MRLPAYICNMKKIIAVLLLFALAIRADAQKYFNDSIAISRNILTENAMITLGSWSIANIATGFTIAGNTTGEATYFWKMNAYWNFINIGLSSLGYAGTRKASRVKYGFADNNKAQQSIEKLYVLNAGLDLVYIMGGLYLRERGKNETNIKSAYQYKGYGSSIIMQGGFLLLLDCTMYMLHHKNTVRLNSKLRNIDFAGGPGSFVVSYGF
jgi:hypothetical protein